MQNFGLACLALFLLASLAKWWHVRARRKASGGYESYSVKGAWDLAWDIIQKVSALLGIATVVLKYAFGIEL